MSQYKTNYRMKKVKMMMRAVVFNQTRYFQDMRKPVFEVQQVGKKFEKLNPLKNKQQTVVKKVEEGLKNKRDKKLSSKLSMDTQLLNISKEESSLKRKLVQQLEKPKEEFNSGMNKVFKSEENISFCIQQTVGILAHLVNQQQAPYQQQYRPPFSPPSFNHQPVTSQSRSTGTLPREMSKMKIRGTKKTREFMKPTTNVLISTSIDIYISFYFTYYFSC